MDRWLHGPGHNSTPPAQRRHAPRGRYTGEAAMQTPFADAAVGFADAAVGGSGPWGTAAAGNRAANRRCSGSPPPPGAGRLDPEHLELADAIRKDDGHGA